MLKDVFGTSLEANCWIYYYNYISVVALGNLCFRIIAVFTNLYQFNSINCDIFMLYLRNWLSWNMIKIFYFTGTICQKEMWHCKPWKVKLCGGVYVQLWTSSTNYTDDDEAKGRSIMNIDEWPDYGCGAGSCHILLLYNDLLA